MPELTRKPFALRQSIHHDARRLRLHRPAVTNVPLLAEHGLGIAYSLYVGFALLALLFMWKSLPETRGRAPT